MTRWGPGPVFAADCMTTARRWQVYAGRAALVAAVLAGLTLVWLNRFAGRVFTSHQELAEVGAAFFHAVMGVELILVLAVVPAAAAGAICKDKVRGGLTLMMATDLSDAEIVLGRFASLMVTVVGVVACGLPTLAITASLGGVDPGEAVGGTLVVVGVAVLGVAVALTYSVWATKPHEALMATYATWAVWLTAALVWAGLPHAPRIPGLLFYTNPISLIFAEGRTASSMPFAGRAVFFAGCLAVSAVLAAASTWRLRPVVLRQSSRPARRDVSRRRKGRRRLWTGEVPAGVLDRDPVLWREWHRRRSSPWVRAIWWLYAVLSTLFTLIALVTGGDLATAVAAIVVSFGLLLVSVTSATALAEERALGGLDVLMASPLTTRAIVIGKWRGAYSVVPRLAILPGLLAFGSALHKDYVLFSLPFAALIVGLVLAYGAVVTSIGLALATWQPRPGRAVALGVAAYLAQVFLYPAVHLSTRPLGPDDTLFLWVSPFFGMVIPFAWVAWPGPWFSFEKFLAIPVWITLTAAVAFGIRWWTLANFDRLVGRVSERPRRPVTAPFPIKQVASRAVPQVGNGP